MNIGNGEERSRTRLRFIRALRPCYFVQLQQLQSSSLAVA